MKINNQYNRYNDIGRRGINNNKASNPFNSALFAHNKNLTFKGFDIPGFLSKIDTPPRSITYTNIDKVTDAIDGIIGKDGYFAAQLEKAGISTKDNIITVDKHTLGGDLISTLKYPIVDMPFDILKAICNGLKKTPLRAVGDAILNIGFIQQKIQKMETQRSYETVLKILNQYCPEGGGPISKLNDAFSQVTADKITKTAKNYDSRDERTINRIVTGGVGVVLSAQDAYNISMLEKNDKEDAKEAEKDRLIQEASRVGISAGLTFLTLGALERYTKGSVFLSALLVAGSTLFAEIASRVFKHKPLIPITPEAAAKIAQKRKPNKPAQPASVVETTRQRMDKQDKNNLFSEFTHSAHITTTGQPADAQPAAQIQQNTQKPAKPSQKQAKAKKRKKIAIIATLLTAFAAASAYYVVSRYAKGDYLAKAARKELLEKNSDRIKAYLADAYAENLDADILKEIDRIKKLKPQNKHLTIFNVLASLKDKITKKSIEVDVEKLEDEINNLLATEGTDDIAPVLGIYKNHIGILKEKNIYKYNDQKVKNIVPNALYDGFGKIFRTLYTALSIPGFIIDSFINKKYKASEE
ncbi:hypothetical protein IJ531_00370, partial [bacterium]|nr:hypothetical protein [bacterium]